MLIIGVMESIGGCGSPCGVNVRSPLVMCWPPWWFTGVGSADQLVPSSLVLAAISISVLPKIMMLSIGVMKSVGGYGSPCGVNVRSPLVMCRPPWWFMEGGPAYQSGAIKSGSGSIFDGGVKWAFARTSVNLPKFFKFYFLFLCSFRMFLG